jgi:hypothetical protein
MASDGFAGGKTHPPPLLPLHNQRLFPLHAKKHAHHTIPKNLLTPLQGADEGVMFAATRHLN